MNFPNQLRLSLMFVTLLTLFVDLISSSVALSMPSNEQSLEIKDPGFNQPTPKKLRDGGILILERRDRDVSDRVHTAISYVNEVTMTIGASDKVCGDKKSSECAQEILSASLSSGRPLADMMKPVPLNAWGQTLEVIDTALGQFAAIPGFDSIKTRKLATIWSLELKKRGYVQETAELNPLKLAQEKAQILRVRIAIGLLLTPDRAIEVSTLYAYGRSPDSSVPAESQPLFTIFGETAESESLAVQSRIESILNDGMTKALLQFSEARSNARPGR